MMLINFSLGQKNPLTKMMYAISVAINPTDFTDPVMKFFVVQSNFQRVYGKIFKFLYI